MAHHRLLNKDDSQDKRCRKVFPWGLCGISYESDSLGLRVALCPSWVPMCFVINYYFGEWLCLAGPLIKQVQGRGLSWLDRWKTGEESEPTSLPPTNFFIILLILWWLVVTRDLPGSDQLYVHCGMLPSAVLHNPTIKTLCVFLPENWLFPWSRKDSHLEIELHLWTSHSFYSSIFCLQRYLLPLICESLIGSTMQIGLLFHFSHCQRISHLHIY